jgi:hypothetical protein
MCRKAHGAPYATYWFLNTDQFSWTCDKSTLQTYTAANSLLKRNFCSCCGSVVPYVTRSGEQMVTPGGCHDEGPKPECNIFVADNAPWHPITNDLPCHDYYQSWVDATRVDLEPSKVVPEGYFGASCLCGAIECEISEPFSMVRNCHCSRCRHGRAAAHTTNGFTSIEAVTFTKGQEHLETYKHPEAQFFSQSFCDVCGSKMPRLDPDRGVAVTPLGCLDDDPKATAANHIFVADKAQWHEISDNLPVFEQGPGPA